MAVLLIALAVWWFAGWKLALCVLLPAFAVESMWLLKKWRNTQAVYSGDTAAREAIQRLSEKLSTSALAESAGVLDEIQAIIEEHNRTYPEDLWAGVADLRHEMAGEQNGGVLNAD
jgi:hypothetical protein